MLVGLGFIIIGGLFVVSTLKSLIALLNIGYDKNKITGKGMLNHFKVPLLSFIALIIFIAWIIPLLDNSNLN